MYLCSEIEDTTMSNQDFWHSIQQIINNKFDAEGLAKLEYYAEQFISNKLVYQRFSPFEQHGCATGGATHVIATLLAGAEVDADSLTAPIGSFKREQQCAEAQMERIKQWAIATNCWIDNVDTTLSNLLGEQIAEGGEAHVYDHGTTLIKIIGLDYYIQPVLALDRISLHNAFFPETRLNVIGFGYSNDGAFQIVVEQPFIHGSSMTDEEIAAYAKAMGFELRNARNWTFATPEIYLSDLHDENVIRSKDGNIFVIDCDIRINTPELKQGGVRTLTNEIIFLAE